MKAACTPSSGCVWFDLKRPCQKPKCAVCTMSEPSIFDLLEPLSAAMIERGGPDIRGGFARGTGGVDMPFIIDALAGTSRACAGISGIPRHAIIAAREAFSPGPWTAEGESIWCTLENRAVVEIARANVLEELHATWAYANASLIAAAPDLYACCEMVLRTDNDWISLSPDERSQIEAAVAKARGEQSL